MHHDIEWEMPEEICQESFSYQPAQLCDIGTAESCALRLSFSVMTPSRVRQQNRMIEFVSVVSRVDTKEVVDVTAAAAPSLWMAKWVQKQPLEGQVGAVMLPSNIELPAPWPPPSLATNPPYYLSSPPAVINISIGRQLFVDDFLIDSQSNVMRYFHKLKDLRTVTGTHVGDRSHGQDMAAVFYDAMFEGGKYCACCDPN